MSADIDLGEIRRSLRHELVAIRGQWVWLLALGIVLVVVGTIAIGMPLVTTLATALTIGVLLLLGGGVQLVGAFWTRRLERLFPDALDGCALHRAGALVRQAAHPGCRGFDPAACLHAYGQRRVPDCRIADASVSPVGLDLRRRRAQPDSGYYDLVAVADFRFLGHRSFCWH